MRKNKFGRAPKWDKRVVKALRDDGNLSFQEIADKLKMKSRQVARYYYLRAVDKNS
jgi:DNA-binding Lrp family transcriptional regulator